MIYWIILGLLFIAAVFNESRLPHTLKCLLLIISTISLTLLAGIRGDIDPDYSNYKEVYDFVNVYLDRGDQSVEYGYLLINVFVKSINLGFQAVIFIMALLSVIPKAIFFYKKSPNFLFSLLIYFSSIYFLFDFIAIRQAVTISIFMVSLVFILEKKIIPYFICIVLGSFIHSSILLLLPGYFFFNRRFSSNILYLIIGICAIINFLQIKIGLLELLLEKFVLPDGAAGKVAIYGMEQNFAFVSLKQILLALIFIFLNSKLRSNVIFINILANIFVVGIIVATLLNGIPQLSYRIKWYFLWPEAVLMVYFVEYISLKKLSIKLLIYSLLLVLYANTMNDLLNELASRGNYIYPYRIFIE